MATITLWAICSSSEKTYIPVYIMYFHFPDRKEPMSDWTDDPWIQKRRHLTPQKTHALGYLTLAWSGCEHWTTEIFMAVSQLPMRIAYIISHDQGDITLWTKIRQIARERNYDPNVQDLLEHAAKMHDICRGNRNQFTHVSLSGAESLDDSVLRLARRKGPEPFGPSLDDSLENVRRVCEEIEILKQFIGGICMGILFRRMSPQDEHQPWPNKPELPSPVWRPTGSRSKKGAQ